MELRQLECFVRTAELGSFTKAARLLHISQPALSKSISLLEDDIGVLLFDRKGKRFVLSPVGIQVLEHARQILDHCQQIQLLGSAEAENKSPVALRMMCASKYFPDIMSGFKSLYPDIQITLLSTILTAREEDSDILIFSSPNEHHYKADKTVMCEELRLLVPPGHPLYERESVSVAEIADYPILSLRTETELRSFEDHHYELAGVSPRREMVCGDSASLRSLLKNGSGIAIVPTQTWDVTSGTGNKLLPINDFHFVRYINVHLPHPNKADKDVQIFFDYLIEYFSRFAAHQPEGI